MKKIVLILGIVICLVNRTYGATWDCGKVKNTVFCTLEENGVFTISGEGEMKNYQRAAGGGIWADDRPWGSTELANGELTNIQKVVVGKGVTYIGTNAFEGFSSVQTLEGGENLEKIGTDAFYGADLDNVNIPNVTEIGDYAFIGNGNLRNINMPNLETSYASSFAGTPIRGYTGDCLQYRQAICIRNEKDICRDNYLLKNNICIDASLGCGENWIDLGGYCERIRYTLPEADELTSNDNENMIEWIFE